MKQPDPGSRFTPYGELGRYTPTQLILDLPSCHIKYSIPVDSCQVFLDKIPIKNLMAKGKTTKNEKPAPI